MRAWVRRHPFWSLGLVLALLAGGLIGGVNLWAWREFQAAREALGEERFDEAHRHIETCLSIWPQSVMAHRLAARIARWRRDYPQAEQHLSACRRLQPTASEDIQLEWLLLRCEQGDQDVVEGLWRSAAADHPESEEILATLARTFMRQLRYPAALHCLNIWLERSPDNPRALDWRGWVWEHLQQQRSALADYQRSLELSPGRDSTRLRLAQLQVSRREVAAALRTLEPLRQSKPNDPEMLLVLGRCLTMEGSLEEAGQFLDTVLAARPEDPAALLARGNVALQMEQPEQAERYFRRGLAISPADVDLLYALFESLRHQPGREEEAEKARDHHRRVEKDLKRLNTLLRTADDPKAANAETASEIGTLLLRLHQESLALSWFDKALAIDPRHRPTHKALADFYEKQKEPEKAQEHRRLAASAP